MPSESWKFDSILQGFPIAPQGAPIDVSLTPQGAPSEVLVHISKYVGVLNGVNMLQNRDLVFQLFFGTPPDPCLDHSVQRHGPNIGWTREHSENAHAMTQVGL